LLIPERTLGLTPGAEARTPTHNASETTPPTASAKSRPPACASEKIPSRPSVPSFPGGSRWAGARSRVNHCIQPDGNCWTLR